MKHKLRLTLAEFLLGYIAIAAIIGLIIQGFYIKGSRPPLPFKGDSQWTLT